MTTLNFRFIFGIIFVSCLNLKKKEGMPLMIRILSLWILLAGGMHKYYVSVTTIEYDPSSRKCRIILYTFPDDVALAINKTFHYDPDWDHPVPKDKMFLEAYLRDHFSLQADGHSIKYDFLGYTFEGEKMLILMETAPLPPSARRLEMMQTWLTDIYPEQKNLVHFIVPSHSKQSEILDAGMPRTVFSIPVNASE